MAQIELREGIADVPRDEWNALVGQESPFLEWDWLAGLEQAGTLGGPSGWQPRPLLVREAGRLIAGCPLYLKQHGEGEFVFDGSWADAAERAGIAYYPKLLVGVPFTPVTGGRCLVAPGRDRAEGARLLAGALRELCLGSRFSGVHVNFCREEEIAPLAESGYLLRVGLQYHWQNAGYRCFEDYLGAFRSKRRNQIRRERRALAEQGVEIEVLVGDQIGSELVDPIFRLYRSTVQQHFWGRQYLNRGFFQLLVERFRHRLCLVVARQRGELVAGTANILKNGVLYGRYWGALRDLRHLHFNVCYYAAIEWAIQHGIARFEPGAGGDYKYLRGFQARPTFSMHFLAEPGLAAAVARFLEQERAHAASLIEQLGASSPLKSAEPA
jgi:predicted N-acyltransferase